MHRTERINFYIDSRQFAELGRTPFYEVSVNGLHRDRVMVRVSGRIRVSVRVRHRDRG